MGRFYCYEYPRDITPFDFPEGYRALLVLDPSPDASYLAQEGFEEREQEYLDGDFEFVQVTLVRDCGECSRTEFVDCIGSIESDSDPGYLEDLAWDLYRNRPE